MSIASPSERLQSLDQYRGYTVAGMFLVNFLGSFDVCPRIWKHTHDYCSYADTIMPQFLFAAGFALRLSFLKHRRHGGSREAWLRMLRRALSLSLIAIVFYSIGDWDGISKSLHEQGWQQTLAHCWKRNWTQTLLHIAITSIWIMPVIWAPVGVRFLYGLVSAAAHVALSAWFNFLWVNGQLDPQRFIAGDANGIDGGPLGFLTWSIVALTGTWACDVCLGARNATPSGEKPKLDGALMRMLIVGWLLAGAGWLMSCGTTIYNSENIAGMTEDEGQAYRSVKFAANPVIPSREQWQAWKFTPAEPPFVPPPTIIERKWNYWMMSQRAGTLSYLTFSAGFSLLVFAVFVWLADVKGIRLGVFRTFGVNALAGYMLADLTAPLAAEWTTRMGFPVTESAPPAIVAAALVLHFLLIYAVLRLMEARRIFIRM